MPVISITKAMTTVRSATMEWVRTRLIDEVSVGHPLPALLFGRELDGISAGTPKWKLPPMKVGEIGSESPVWRAEGGERFWVPVRYALKAGEWIGRNDEVNTNENDGVTMLNGDWKLFSYTVTVNKITNANNRASKTRLFSYIDEQIAQCRLGALQTLSEGFNGSAGEGDKQVTGIQDLVKVNNTTGTRLGVDLSVAANVNFTNRSTSAAGNPITYQAVEDLYYDCIGIEGYAPGLFGYTTVTNFKLLKREADQTQRINVPKDDKIAALGFEHFMFNNTHAVVMSPQAPTTQFRWLTRTSIKPIINSAVWFDDYGWNQALNKPQVEANSTFAEMELVSLEGRRVGVLHTLAN